MEHQGAIDTYPEYAVLPVVQALREVVGWPPYTSNGTQATGKTGRYRRPIGVVVFPREDSGFHAPCEGKQSKQSSDAEAIRDSGIVQ